MKRFRPNHRSVLRRVLQDTRFARQVKRSYDAFKVGRWRKGGSVDPPPHAYKRALVRRLSRRLGYRVFVETGTFYGDMLADVSSAFSQIISIELDPNLCRLARCRFADQAHIQVVAGDSGVLLKEVLTLITEPCIFWLDAHFSGAKTAMGPTETPILAEVEAILSHRIRDHVILIDDARCFDGTHDYPSVSSLCSRVAETSGRYEIAVHNDVIRVWPRHLRI